MNETEFQRLAAQGFNRIPIIVETFADLDTPLSVYLKLANKRYSYLLESVVGGERFGRYSFIGLPARRRIVVDTTQTQLLAIAVGRLRAHGSPVHSICGALNRHQRSRCAPTEDGLFDRQGRHGGCRCRARR